MLSPSIRRDAEIVQQRIMHQIVQLLAQQDEWFSDTSSGRNAVMGDSDTTLPSSWMSDQLPSTRWSLSASSWEDRGEGRDGRLSKDEVVPRAPRDVLLTDRTDISFCEVTHSWGQGGYTPPPSPARRLGLDLVQRDQTANEKAEDQMPKLSDEARPSRRQPRWWETWWCGSVTDSGDIEAAARRGVATDWKSVCDERNVATNSERVARNSTLEFVDVLVPWVRHAVVRAWAWAWAWASVGWQYQEEYGCRRERSMVSEDIPTTRSYMGNFGVKASQGRASLWPSREATDISTSPGPVWFASGATGIPRDRVREIVVWVDGVEAMAWQCSSKGLVGSPGPQSESTFSCRRACSGEGGCREDLPINLPSVRR